MAVGMTISQLVFLGLELCQRREAMWSTPMARVMLVVSALLAMSQSGWFLFAWASGRQQDLIWTDCLVHVLLLVPGIIANLSVYAHAPGYPDHDTNHGDLELAPPEGKVPQV